jgi:hypothetical protein
MPCHGVVKANQRTKKSTPGESKSAHEEWTLARAHARSGDAAAIANYLGTSDKFDRAMATFAEAYADQNDRDYATLKAAVDSKVAAESA